MNRLKDKKVAIVYDRVNKWGGAERVLLALHSLFPNAPLYTSVYDPNNAPWASKLKVITSFLQRLPFAGSHHELLAPLMPIAFESFNFDNYDLVISVTSEAAKGIITKPGTLHVCYCLTPTRYLWSGYEEYFSNKFFRFLCGMPIDYLKKWDKIACQRPDAYIAISKEVQKRIKKYYGRESEVVYPPVEISNIKYEILNKVKTDNQYFLVVSRLSKFTKYKRIDLAIKACRQLNLPLKIIGSGSWVEELKRNSGKTIEFIGNVTDSELAKYYKNCRALIFPGIEDLGLTMIEAQSFGKPVIAYKEGGALEIIEENKTGVFFSPQTTGALEMVLQNFDSGKFSSDEIIKSSLKFSPDNFRDNFMRILTKISEE